MESLGIELALQEISWERDFQERFESLRVDRDQQQRRPPRDRHRHRRHEQKLKSKAGLSNGNSDKEHTTDDAIISPTCRALNKSSEKSLKYAAFMLPKFDGNWVTIDPVHTDLQAATWIKSVDRCAAVFSWTECEALLAARMSLEGDAKQWLMTQQLHIVTWSDFKLVFEKRYRKNKCQDKKVENVKEKKENDAIEVQRVRYGTIRKRVPYETIRTRVIGKKLRETLLEDMAEDADTTEESMTIAADMCHSCTLGLLHRYRTNDLLNFFSLLGMIIVYVMQITNLSKIYTIFLDGDAT